jgi:hypothetical protein
MAACHMMGTWLVHMYVFKLPPSTVPLACKSTECKFPLHLSMES